MEDSLLIPIPVAATLVFLSFITEDVPEPAAEAVLGDTCRTRAISPVVAEPDAVANLGSTCTHIAVDVEFPEAAAVRSIVCSTTIDEVPEASPVACLDTVLYPR